MPAEKRKEPRKPRREPLQINDDVVYQQHTWAVERIGWVVMGLLLLAAIAGAFAVGPLSSAEAQDPSGLMRVGYERFQRYRAPSDLKILLAAAATTGGSVVIHINTELTDAVQIQNIMPEPEHAKATRDGVELTFQVAEPGEPTAVRFSFKTQRMGTVHAEVALAGREPARFDSFVYP